MCNKSGDIKFKRCCNDLLPKTKIVVPPGGEINNDSPMDEYRFVRMKDNTRDIQFVAHSTYFLNKKVIQNESALDCRLL